MEVDVVRHDDSSHNGHSIVDRRPCHPWNGNTYVAACTLLCKMQMLCISLYGMKQQTGFA